MKTVSYTFYLLRFYKRLVTDIQLVPWTYLILIWTSVKSLSNSSKHDLILGFWSSTCNLLSKELSVRGRSIPLLFFLFCQLSKFGPLSPLGHLALPEFQDQMRLGSRSISPCSELPLAWLFHVMLWTPKQWYVSVRHILIVNHYLLMANRPCAYLMNLQHSCPPKCCHPLHAKHLQLVSAVCFNKSEK